MIGVTIWGTGILLDQKDAVVETQTAQQCAKMRGTSLYYGEKMFQGFFII